MSRARLNAAGLSAADDRAIAAERLDGAMLLLSNLLAEAGPGAIIDAAQMAAMLDLLREESRRALH